MGNVLVISEVALSAQPGVNKLYVCTRGRVISNYRLLFSNGTYGLLFSQYLKLQLVLIRKGWSVLNMVGGQLFLPLKI